MSLSKEEVNLVASIAKLPLAVSVTIATRHNIDMFTDEGLRLFFKVVKEQYPEFITVEVVEEQTNSTQYDLHKEFFRW